MSNSDNDYIEIDDSIFDIPEYVEKEFKKKLRDLSY